MIRHLGGLALTLTSLWTCCGCGDAGPARKPTSAVVGKVLVDGKPVENLAVYCVRISAADKEHPTESKAYTTADGSFKMNTYASGDGVPEGEYVLTFQWGTMNLFTHSYDGDELHSRYKDPETSVVKFEVKKGKPVDLGEIKLTTE